MSIPQLRASADRTHVPAYYRFSKPLNSMQQRSPLFSPPKPCSALGRSGRSCGQYRMARAGPERTSSRRVAPDPDILSVAMAQLRAASAFAHRPNVRPRCLLPPRPCMLGTRRASPRLEAALCSRALTDFIPLEQVNHCFARAGPPDDELSPMFQYGNWFQDFGARIPNEHGIARNGRKKYRIVALRRGFENCVCRI